MSRLSFPEPAAFDVVFVCSRRQSRDPSRGTICSAMWGHWEENWACPSSDNLLVSSSPGSPFLVESLSLYPHLSLTPTLLIGATLPTTVLFMFTWCLYVRKKPARPHCHCYPKTRRKEAGLETDDPKETDPLLRGGSPEGPAAAEPTVVVAPRLSWRARASQLLPFLGLFTPLVVFWAIFYQQSSTWVIQGRQMDCYIGKLHVPPGMSCV